MEVTDIAKIVRKKIRFWILQMKTHKVELVKNVKKKTFLILQMKTHIRDNHAEYRKIETSGLNPNRFEPKFCLKSVKKKHLNLLKKTFEVILNEKIRCGTCNKNMCRIFQVKTHRK